MALSSPSLVTRFQSTPPVKAATGTVQAVFAKTDISIHAAREGGDADSGVVRALRVISIHAAREGGDAIYQNSFQFMRHFNPRRP